MGHYGDIIDAMDEEYRRNKFTDRFRFVDTSNGVKVTDIMGFKVGKICLYMDGCCFNAKKDAVFRPDDLLEIANKIREMDIERGGQQ